MSISTGTTDRGFTTQTKLQFQAMLESPDLVNTMMFNALKYQTYFYLLLFLK